MSFVTESIPIIDFFKCLERLQLLEHISFPRSPLTEPRNDKVKQTAECWPPALQSLKIPPTLYSVLYTYGPHTPVALDTVQIYATFVPPWEARFLSERISSIRRVVVKGLGSNHDRPSNHVARHIRRSVTKHDILVLEILRQKNIEVVLEMYRYPAAERIWPLRALEELVMGPFNRDELAGLGLYSNTDADKADELWESIDECTEARLNARGGLESLSTLAACLPFHQVVSGQFLPLRRIVLHVWAVPPATQVRSDGTTFGPKAEEGWPLNAASVADVGLLKLSRRLIDLELRRMEENGPEYIPKECGVFMVPYRTEFSFDRNKDAAICLSDLTKSFPVKTLQTWTYTSRELNLE